MTKRKHTQPNYQDRYDSLKIAQVTLASFVAGVFTLPDVSPYVLFGLLAVQTGIVFALVLTRRRMKAAGLSVVDLEPVEDTPRHERATLPNSTKDQL